MSRDCLIALHDYVPSEIATPLELGAVRSSESATTWFDDAQAALARGERAVLSGFIDDIQDLAAKIHQLYAFKPEGRIAVLLHWPQALRFARSDAYLTFGLFEATYVALDCELGTDDLKAIQRLARVRWVLIPTHDVRWTPWIPTTLLPEKRGLIHIFAASTQTSRRLLDCDELRLQLAEFSVEHPLIRFRPVPAEWFVPSQITPWRMESRDPRKTRVVVSNRPAEESPETRFAVSVVIPFRWSGSSETLGHLQKSLESARDLSTKDFSCETILAVDRDASVSPLSEVDIPIDLPNLTIVENVRIDTAEDWRAGFMRNCGAAFAHPASDLLLFLDADVVIQDAKVLQEALQSESSELWALENDSSSLLGIRKKTFQHVGGFADAFNHYGCEDNLLVWKARHISARINPISASWIKHVRPRLADDELAFKMRRLQPSANLLYRMTLAPDIHAHFYSCLGSTPWIRAGVKRAMWNSFLRFLLGLVVFVMTMIEAEKRSAYIGGFYDVLIWKLKHPLLWLRGNSWRTRVAWLRSVGHIRHIKSILTVFWIRLKGESWRPKVFWIRMGGQLTKGLGYIRGQIIRFSAWLVYLFGFVKKETWFFREPTEWFRRRVPTFYRWVWRPILKSRYFLEYHLFKRWRSL